MTEPVIDTKTLKIASDLVQIDAYLAKPQQQGTYPGIVVLQEIFGVNFHIQQVTERIAREGYVAIAPALFQRQAPGFTTGYTPEDIELGRNYAWGETKASELLSDIQSTINYLKTLPEVKRDAFGCIGFCFGGHVAYLAASLTDIKATASFYGARITTSTPGGGTPTINVTSQIQGRLYAFFGMEDSGIPSEQVDTIAAELEKHKVQSNIFRYKNAQHGFFCDRRASYNAEAAKDAWEKVKELFGEL
ncbi:MAG: dienelactone hydrolase family protein [Cyanobacteria bacterium J06632_19]